MPAIMVLTPGSSIHLILSKLTLLHNYIVALLHSMYLIKHRNYCLLPPSIYLFDFLELRISEFFKGFKLVTTHE